ncbi:MAG: DUF1624 domain-containing protein, partial [Actinobacteria bacterium]|nr:DUF1624 domain-containing protein [Actinomycetota bacterium]
MAAAPVVTPARRAWRRLDGPGRLTGIDLARGLAVLGMLAAHLLTIELFDPGDPSTWLDIVNGRSSILFATLAGVSIALVTGGPRPLPSADRPRAAARLAVRAAVLWVIGILLITTGVPVYVILPAYAVLFLLALPFLGWSAGPLFLAAAAFGLVMPWVQPFLNAAPIWSGALGVELFLGVGWAYPFTVWIAFLLAGMGVGRLDLRGIRGPALLALSGAVLAVIGYTVPAATTAFALQSVYMAEVWTALDHS